MELNYKLWLEESGEKVFGDGPWDLLRRVKESGSLRQAADQINMSYSQAWTLLDELESRLGFDLLASQAGGSAGGGSELTEKGELLAKTFGNFRREAEATLAELEDKHFEAEFFSQLKK